MKHLSSIVVFLLTNIALQAHDPTEIAYVFEQDQLIIYWTPKSALDLISNLKPELSERSVVHLSEYTADYEAYFNDRITIKSSNKSKRLLYVSSDLTRHDAFIQFKIMDIQGHKADLQIEVDAFKDIYPNVDNQIVRHTDNDSKDAGYESSIDILTNSWSHMIPILLIIGFVVQKL